MATSALTPLSEAVFAVLQNATLQAATTGGWWDDFPQAPSYPCGLYELFGSRDTRGLGTGNQPEIDLRFHVFTDRGRKAQGQAIVDLVIDLFKDAALTVTGFRQCGLTFYDETDYLPDEEILGVKVCEWVIKCRVILEP